MTGDNFETKKSIAGIKLLRKIDYHFLKIIGVIILIPVTIVMGGCYLTVIVLIFMSLFHIISVTFSMFMIEIGLSLITLVILYGIIYGLGTLIIPSKRASMAMASRLWTHKELKELLKDEEFVKVSREGIYHSKHWICMCEQFIPKSFVAVITDYLDSTTDSLGTTGFPITYHFRVFAAYLVIGGEPIRFNSHRPKQDPEILRTLFRELLPNAVIGSREDIPNTWQFRSLQKYFFDCYLKDGGTAKDLIYSANSMDEVMVCNLKDSRPIEVILREYVSGDEYYLYEDDSAKRDRLKAEKKRIKAEKKRIKAEKKKIKMEIQKEKQNQK